MPKFTLRNQFFGLILLAISIVAVACNGQYFKATKYYSAQIEEALESIKAPAFYNVFVTLKERDIFQLDYFFYDREARSVMGVYKFVNPELAERNYKYAPGMNRYTRNKNGSIDGPGGLVYEIRIQANEVIFDGGTASEGVRVKIPIENIYQLDLLEHKEAVGILYKLLGGIAATGAAATLTVDPVGSLVDSQ